VAGRLALLASVLLALLAGAAVEAQPTPLLLGVDVTEYTGGEPPNCYGASVLYDYGQPQVRRLVRGQLAAMRAGGAESIRLFLTYDDNTSENPYFVPARSGRLEEPFRTNLVNYLADARAAGFARLTLAFDARGSVQPAQQFPNNNYDPSTFAETWSLIRDVRPLLKQYGPPDTRIDLLNEGAPGDYLTQQVSSWISRMYANYVDAFGADDVTVSAGFWTGMSGLVQALRASGKQMPQWFDVHPRWEPGQALQDLRAVDAELTANGLSQPIVIGEEKYNDPSVAATIAEFARTSARRVEEVIEWPLEHGGGEPANQQTRCISPPYRLDAYATALKGASPSTTLAAAVADRTLDFRTAYGQRVTALLAGTYTVRVRDISNRRGFLLDARRTTAPFRGTVTWKITFSAGTHTFGATGRSPRKTSFVVLPPG
jgi:hypothetical protein